MQVNFINTRYTAAQKQELIKALGFYYKEDATLEVEAVKGLGASLRIIEDGISYGISYYPNTAALLAAVLVEARIASIRSCKVYSFISITDGWQAW